jgi:hypothetical protein
MPYSYPADLAHVIAGKWIDPRDEGVVIPPALPEIDPLTELLETVFFASMEEEEGRPLRFTVTYSEAETVKRQGSEEEIEIIGFKTPIPLSVATVRSLAPAATAEGASILVRPSPDGEDGQRFQIAGILHSGSEFIRARDTKTFNADYRANLLHIEVWGAGDIHVYRGSTKLVFLEVGKLAIPLEISAWEFTPADLLLAEGQARLEPRVERSLHESPARTSSFFRVSLLHTMLNVVNTIKSQHHGGTLLVIDQPSVNGLPIKLKFPVDEQAHLLDQTFVDFMSSRNKYQDAMHVLAKAEDRRPIENNHFRELVTLIEAERSLMDAGSTVGAFGCVDGALVLDSSLRVKGFGGEILLDRAPSVQVYEVRDNALVTSTAKELDSESFGMRHRSAVRFVAATPKSVALIISQDGKVSFCWTKDGRTCLKRGVSTSNPNMWGA